MLGRSYDPFVGRWLSRDEDIGKGVNPQSLNRYNYVENNPLKYIDIFGFVKVVAIGSPISLKQSLDYTGSAAKHYSENSLFNSVAKYYKEKGYKVVQTPNGDAFMSKLEEVSSPDDPITELIVVSHGGKAGLYIYQGEGSGGVYTDDEYSLQDAKDLKSGGISISQIIKNSKIQWNASFVAIELQGCRTAMDIKNLITQKLHSKNITYQFGKALLKKVESVYAEGRIGPATLSIKGKVRAKAYIFDKKEKVITIKATLKKEASE